LVSRVGPLTYFVLALALLALGYAAVTDQQGLMAGAALLLAVASWPLRGLWRWTALAAYPAAFLASLVLPGSVPSLFELLGALCVIGGLGLTTLREQASVREVAWQRNTIDALRVGSERLADARDADAIIRAGVGILDKLRVAPNLAFVAYRKGTPHILAAKAAVCRPITGWPKKLWRCCPKPNA
jgi:hypothetical protein